MSEPLLFLIDKKLYLSGRAATHKPEVIFSFYFFRMDSVAYYSNKYNLKSVPFLALSRHRLCFICVFSLLTLIFVFLVLASLSLSLFTEPSLAVVLVVRVGIGCSEVSILWCVEWLLQ